MRHHLTDVDLIDCIDAAELPVQHRMHLEGCEDCGNRLAKLRTTLEDVQTLGTEIPEPSPLFWDHFSRRVREGIDSVEPAHLWTRRIVLLPTAAALVFCAVALVVWNQNRFVVQPVPAVAGNETSATFTAVEEPLDLEQDAEWALVRIAADGLEWDTVAEAGIRAHPGSAEDVALEMSTTERQELERLIEAEMKQTGA